MKQNNSLELLNILFRYFYHTNYPRNATKSLICFSANCRLLDDIGWHWMDGIGRLLWTTLASTRAGHPQSLDIRTRPGFGARRGAATPRRLPPRHAKPLNRRLLPPLCGPADACAKVVLANLRPPVVDEMDSFMYQTVGHEAIELLAEAMGLPLVRAAGALLRCGGGGSDLERRGAQLSAPARV